MDREDLETRLAEMPPIQQAICELNEKASILYDMLKRESATDRSITHKMLEASGGVAVLTGVLVDIGITPNSPHVDPQVRAALGRWIGQK